MITEYRPGENKAGSSELDTQILTQEKGLSVVGAKMPENSHT